MTEVGRMVTCHCQREKRLGEVGYSFDIRIVLCLSFPLVTKDTKLSRKTSSLESLRPPAVEIASTLSQSASESCVHQKLKRQGRDTKPQVRTSDSTFPAMAVGRGDPPSSSSHEPPPDDADRSLYRVTQRFLTSSFSSVTLFLLSTSPVARVFRCSYHVHVKAQCPHAKNPKLSCLNYSVEVFERFAMGIVATPFLSLLYFFRGARNNGGDRGTAQKRTELVSLSDPSTRRGLGSKGSEQVVAVNRKQKSPLQ